jgi:hypothetical protein
MCPRYEGKPKVPVADEGAGELEQGQVDGGLVFVAGAEAFEGVQPGEAALDDPPVRSEA